MPEPFAFISRYFWLIAIVIGLLNFWIAKQRAARAMDENPDLREGYGKLLWGYLAVTTLPWAVMGVGMVVGGVPTIWYYFRPRDGNPFVLVWYGTVIALNLVLFLWVFFQGGAEFLATHPGITRGQSPAAIRLQFALMLLGAVAAVVFLWFVNPTVG